MLFGPDSCLVVQLGGFSRHKKIEILLAGEQVVPHFLRPIS